MGRRKTLMGWNISGPKLIGAALLLGIIGKPILRTDIATVLAVMSIIGVLSLSLITGIHKSRTGRNLKLPALIESEMLGYGVVVFVFGWTFANMSSTQLIRVFFPEKVP